ncbi:PTS sugar transporter subunit IIC [Vallitalea pronyensis]|uniref:PTS sugar transporter subunit IIC n=1 Tax=Vallitalea pronyensis TaxID=1348613 RepID=A0A8J8MG59_9FIRM|nr:PTS sugar transporter subunit IIC [Vallitalea pronyensis]QUI20985.1 PTS sugar transporter subunit IIC [Vallitalea pronyensis]
MNIQNKDTKQSTGFTLKKLGNRYFVDGLSGMALGLFSTLIIGLIIKQLGSLIGKGTIGTTLVHIGSIATVMTGAGIGVGVAHKLKASPLVIYASIVSGLVGAYAGKIMSGQAFLEGNILFIGPGEPLGAFIAVMVGIEVGRLVSGKTKLDILLSPMVTILSGSAAGLLVGPSISAFMNGLGHIIEVATVQQPFLMGIFVSVLMGMILTLPISSAALSIILGLNGLAAGAATVGCATQMVGFAVASYRENKMNGLIAQGLGTSMLQVPNIVKNPRIWIPPIIASAILGPVSTLVFKMENNPYGGGMGTSGLVGQLMTYDTMIDSEAGWLIMVKIGLLHVILPAILTYILSKYCRIMGWIKEGDMTLKL